MPTESIKNMRPKPMNRDAAREMSSSFDNSRVNLVLVTSYTKNHAVKNIPNSSRIVER